MENLNSTSTEAIVCPWPVRGPTHVSYSLSFLVAPIILPYTIPHVTPPLRSFDYIAHVCLTRCYLTAAFPFLIIATVPRSHEAD